MGLQNASVRSRRGLRVKEEAPGAERFPADPAAETRHGQALGAQFSASPLLQCSVQTLIFQY